MAIAIGSRVALKVTGSNLVLGQVTAQPPVFGVSETAGGGPYIIDWENGKQTSSVPLGVLDELFAANSTTLDLVGKVVVLTDASSSYNAVVVDAYNRNATHECVLVKTLQNGTYYELDATTVELVTGL
jgi:hypothetical protein